MILGHAVVVQREQERGLEREQEREQERPIVSKTDHKKPNEPRRGKERPKESK